MPNRDGTGPMGQGPMTGWGRGKCNDANTSNSGWFGFGRGRGRGFGAVRGLGWRLNVYGQSQNEENYLKSSIDFLKNQLKALEDRLNSLKNNE